MPPITRGQPLCKEHHCVLKEGKKAKLNKAPWLDAGIDCKDFPSFGKVFELARENNERDLCLDVLSRAGTEA